MKISGFKYGDAIVCRWRDAGGSGGWASIHDIPSEPICVDQLGYYLRHDEKALHIAQGIPNVEDCVVLAPSCIPLGCVESIKKVKV